MISGFENAGLVINDHMTNDRKVAFQNAVKHLRENFFELHKK